MENFGKLEIEILPFKRWRFCHLKDGDFAISSKALGLNADSETATGKKKPTKNSVAEPNQASSALEIPDEITDEILGESSKNVEDDAMEDQEPKG